MRKARIEIDGWPGFYRWHMRGLNGEVMFHSEGYTRKADAVRAAKRAKKLMETAEIVK